MALLQLMSEERIAEDRIDDYFERLYRVVCVAEKPVSRSEAGTAVRSTYIVDWEQLVHLLEDYSYFGEDIVEVSSVGRDEAHWLSPMLRNSTRPARA